MAAEEAGDQSESDNDGYSDNDNDSDGDEEPDTSFVGVAVRHHLTPASTNGTAGPEPRSKTTYRVRLNMPAAVRKPPNPDTLAQHLPKSTLPPLQHRPTKRQC